MLILISGLPGTGKTYFANALSKKIEAIHLNTDIVRDRAGLRGAYDDQSKQEVYQKLLALVEEALSNDLNTIVDATFYLKKLRTPFLNLAQKFNAPVAWIKMQTDEEVVKKRVSKDRPYSEADFKVYLKIKEQYEPLEGHYLVLNSGEASLNEMLEETQLFLKRFS